MKSSSFSAITLCAVARPAERLDRVLLFERATAFITSLGGEVNRVSGKKGYVSLKRVRNRLANLLAMEGGFDLQAGPAPFRVRVEMDDWTFAASLDDNVFVLSKVLCDDAAQVEELLIGVARDLPGLYTAHVRERRCDRGPVLAELGLALGLPPDDPEGPDLSRWFNSREDRTWEPYLRDVYPVNILSVDALERIKVGNESLGMFIEGSTLGTIQMLGVDRCLWRVSEEHRLVARERLLAHDVLVVGHAAGTHSQRGVTRDVVYESV